MCRKKHMQGWCAVAFGLGLLIGFRLESFLICGSLAVVLLLLGLSLLRGK